MAIRRRKDRAPIPRRSFVPERNSLTWFEAVYCKGERRESQWKRKASSFRNAPESSKSRNATTPSTSSSFPSIYARSSLPSILSLTPTESDHSSLRGQTWVEHSREQGTRSGWGSLGVGILGGELRGRGLGLGGRGRGFGGRRGDSDGLGGRKVREGRSGRGRRGNEGGRGKKGGGG